MPTATTARVSGPSGSGKGSGPPWRRRLFLGLGGLTVVGLVELALLMAGTPPRAAIMAGIAVLMAAWWVFEVVPIPVTSLIPIVALPLAGIADLGATTANYGKPTIFLFLGGFILALGLQRSGVHRRIALHIVRAIGSRPSRLVLGFMLASATLSMWISNTASVMVILPIALSVLNEAKERGAARETLGALGLSIMLGIAYAADMGGMATPVGTPPNLVLIELQGDLLPGLPPITFAKWTMMGLPLTAAFVGCGWYLLAYRLFPTADEPVFGGSDVVRESLIGLGEMRRDEKLAAIVFALTAVAWLTGSDLQLAEGMRISGWRTVLEVPEMKDGAVAITGALVLFLLPSSDRPGRALLEWEWTRTRIPWGLLLLFGGGFALAMGFQSSGLSTLIGSGLVGLKGISTVVVVIAVCVVLTFLTELTSNTATTALVLPILANAAIALGVDPRALMIPATLSASCAFMMPVASPTQAIVFASGWVPIRQMVRAGIWFNVLGIVLVTLVFLLIGAPLFGIPLSSVAATP